MEAYDLLAGQCQAALGSTEFVYDGTEKKPAVTSVQFGDVTLTEGKDYTVSYENNVNAGTAEAVITGNGRTAVNAKKLAFGIAKAEQVLRADAMMIDVESSTKAAVRGAEGTLTYSSADPAVAEVAEDGTITAVAEGTTTIAVKAEETENYNASEEIEFTVEVVRLPGKTTRGDSYVLQYCERQDMVGAKTKVVLGADKTSYTIGGLKKG